VVAYQETYSPAFIRDERGHDLFVHGKMWIDDATGRLVKSEMSVKRLTYADANRKTASDAAVHEGYQVDVIVEFGPQPDVESWPPRRMSELCESKDVAAKAMVGNSMSTETGEVVEALASYSDYKPRQ
jgi:hypothetical protein